MGMMIAALIAAFFFYRLWLVLGRRDDNTPARPPRPDPFARVPDMMRRAVPQPAAPPFDLAAPVDQSEEFMSLDASLKRLKQLDANFDEKQFLAGAKQAFHLVVNAYATGDLAPVKAFIGDDVRQAFETGIAARVASGETNEVTIQALSATIDAARLTGTVARLTVGFHSTQTIVTKDAHGAVSASDPKRPEEMEDLWTFARDTKSPDPNWMLVETHHRG
jgi:predicted lipid-binding transport protein (Tim44 family)